MERPEPPIPQIVKYLNFAELVKDARKLSDPWVVIHHTDILLVLVRIDDDADVEIKLTFNSNYQPMVAWQGA